MALARVCLRVMEGHLAEDGVGLLQLGSGEQADRLGHELPADDRGLVITKRRRFRRGVLALVERGS
jgi:hypothetical protein